MTATIDNTIVSALAASIVIHAIRDYVKFQALRNDVMWIKAALRHHGISAPSGDEDKTN